MGTDIHLFLEYNCSRTEDAFSHQRDIRSLSKGEFFVGRNYELFNAIAGARARSEGGVPENLCKFKPRSLPGIVSSTVFHRYYRLIADMVSAEHTAFLGPWGIWKLPTVAPDQAEEWVKSGLSHYKTADSSADAQVVHRYVSDPEWHSPGWLFLDEFFEAIDYAGVVLRNEDIEVKAIVEATSTLEKVLGIRSARWVFWFDN